MLGGCVVGTEVGMALAVAERLGRMSPEEFREFYDGRPEEERWELYDGGPVQMMTPPFPAHNRIGSNLERLLNEALAAHDPARLAYQRLGVELPEAGSYRPEPDIVVIDADIPSDQRFIDRVYLLAEIISSTDRERVPGSRQTRINAKRSIYRQHASCEAVLVVEQDRIEVLVELRTAEGWTSKRLVDRDDVLALPTFGLRCRVGDVYANTPLVRREGAAG